jgi:ADP-heptose:LPS heptosyltransferase
VKVLIVKTSALGDVVHALPVLAWLKSADPDMQIGWLVEKAFAPLLEDHPLIDKIHPIDTKSWRKKGRIEGLRGLYRTLVALRAERYDVALDLPIFWRPITRSSWLMRIIISALVPWLSQGVRFPLDMKPLRPDL